LLTWAGGTAPWLAVKSISTAYSNSSYWLYEGESKTLGEELIFNFRYKKKVSHPG